MLKIYNTLAREKQEFHPLVPGKVGLYVCGMTIYDYCHVGHARMLIAFDVAFRWLRASGYDVTYVRNITDIEDKIIRRATENNESISALTERFIGYMHEDIAALGIEPPTHEPRARAYVPQMLGLIKKLEQNKLAYATDAGDVNFAVRDFPGYGKLSGKSLEQLRAGERVAIDANKHDPLDFVLWKHAKDDEPEDAKWASPWGPGRPGWHIECSAMATAMLGTTFDIHGGGTDLQFPHHENEIAQSEGASGQPFARYWMHNGFLNVGDEKMSKSLNNFFTIRDVLKVFDAEVLRFFLMRTQYRSGFNYSLANLEDAKIGLTRLYTALRDVTPDDEPLDWDEPHAARFKTAMDDDFNTPIAFAVLFDLATVVNREGRSQDARQLKRLGAILGLLQRDPVAFSQSTPLGTNDAGQPDSAQITARVAERTAAKAAKDFARSDRIRAELLAEGIVLEDSREGTVWRRT